MNDTPTPRTETDLFEATKVSLEYGNQRLFKKSQSTRIVGEVAFSDGYEYALKHSSKIKQLERELAAVTEQRDSIDSMYHKVIKEVLKCDPIPACQQEDDQLESPWEVIARIREQRDRLADHLQNIGELVEALRRASRNQ